MRGRNKSILQRYELMLEKAKEIVRYLEAEAATRKRLNIRTKRITYAENKELKDSILSRLYSSQNAKCFYCGCHMFINKNNDLDSAYKVIKQIKSDEIKRLKFTPRYETYARLKKEFEWLVD